MKMKKLITMMLLLTVCGSTLLSFDASVALAKPKKDKVKPVKVMDTVKTFAETGEEMEDVEESAELEEDMDLDEDADLEETEDGEEMEKPEKVKTNNMAAPALANKYLKEMGIRHNVNGVNLIALLAHSLSTDPLLQTAEKTDREAYNTMVVEFIRTQNDLRMTLEPVITLE